MKSQRGQAALILIIPLVALLAFGAWQLGWWINGSAVNHTAKINRQSYEVQQTYREVSVGDIAKISDIDTQILQEKDPATRSALRAQRTAVVRQTCDAISRLTTSGAGVDPVISSFQYKECIA